MKKLILSILIGVQLFATPYVVNPAHSYIQFGVKNMLLPYTEGRFKEFQGVFDYDAEKKRFTMLEGIVATQSVDTQSEMRDEHLRSADFFDVEEYPTMKLHFVRNFKDKMFTKLTIKDVTKSVIFKVSESHVGEKDKSGNNTRVFVLKATIDRQEFHVIYNTTFGPGEMMIEDEVDITLFIEGIEGKF